MPVNKIIDDIFNIECPILDIGYRTGSTGYIDFIRPEELGSSRIMKGVDRFGRRFIVFKSRIILESGPIECFTTFFKRYKEENSTTCHTAGHYGRHLFCTEGGTTIYQMNLLYDLLKNGSIDMTYEELTIHRFITYSYFQHKYLANDEDDVVNDKVENQDLKWDAIKNMISRVTI